MGKKKRIRLQDTENSTLHILETCPASRNNIGLLVAMVWSYTNPAIRGMNYCHVMENCEKYGLPSFESVSRTRRRIVTKRPDLLGSDEVEKGRREEEKRYEEYARGLD